jgi:hypothetical protein
MRVAFFIHFSSEDFPLGTDHVEQWGGQGPPVLRPRGRVRRQRLEVEDRPESALRRRDGPQSPGEQRSPGAIDGEIAHPDSPWVLRQPARPGGGRGRGRVLIRR